MSKRKKQKSSSEPKSKEIVFDYSIPRSYKRGVFSKAFRYFGVSILLLLNLSMIMSLIERAQAGRLIHPLQEGMFFVFLLIIDALLLVPLLFEANRVETNPEFIRLYTLFWRRTLKWDQIRGFEAPKFFKYAILKTARCFYLINKYDLKPFDELASTISHNTANKGKISQK